jgi:hypothetical protein
MRIVAYYPQDSGYLICPECARLHWTQAELSGTGENPYALTPVFDYSETDTLGTCDICGAIIEEELTEDGVRWLWSLDNRRGPKDWRDTIRAYRLMYPEPDRF